MKTFLTNPDEPQINITVDDSADTFIRTTAQLHLSASDVQFLKNISVPGVEWENIFRKSVLHRVDTLIYYSLKKNCLLDILPDEIVRKYKTNYYCIAIHNSILNSEIKSLSAHAGTKIILLKGTDLMNYFYPDIAIRSTSDIDLLIEKENVKEAWLRIRDSGFINEWSEPLGAYKSSLHKKLSQMRQVRINLDAYHHLPPLRNEKGTSVEIHWNLFVSGELEPVTLEAIRTARKIKDNIYVLSDEMRLLNLCEHFYAHLSSYGVMAYRGICDINELVREKQNTLEWDYIKDLISGNKLNEIVVYVLSLCYQFCNTPIPSAFLDTRLFSSVEITLDILFGKLKLVDNYFEDSLYSSPVTAGMKHMPIRKKKVSHVIQQICFIRKNGSVFRYGLKTVFPDISWMKFQYGKYGKAVWAYYPYYWWRVLKKYLFKKEIQVV